MFDRSEKTGFMGGSSNLSGAFKLPVGRDDRLDHWVDTASFKIPAPGAEFDVPGWPTVITDHWYYLLLSVPNITPGRILSDSVSESSTGSNITTPIVQQAACKQRCSRSKDGLKRNQIILSFGIGKQSTYYVHENSFSSNPGSLAFSKIAIDATDAMIRLANIDQGLQKRGTLVKDNRSRLNLNMLIYREGALFVESYSLPEYAMDAYQEFLQILTSLRGSR